MVHMKLKAFTQWLSLMVPNSSDWMTSYLLDQKFNIEMLTALFAIMPAHFLKVEMCDMIQIYLRWQKTFLTSF